ncbi:GlxA family transcriptional regulator [Sinorhizobium meliloti]|uniref:GlxA family transcriptional regulator n=1 Tax=Rhizobium meliloti TaxID=382 RepID=UPI0013E2F835|nr:GlxA family transcriptional regulator [Sinorhizobium meliloti]MCK3784985.1 GlxA family transcriptional regulator [Sinorhizobium meliloti]MCK3791110.1 GlxA family transcriptional regulator [Sinorhizobium meliloti]MCK3797761.1 GlxA family transcriptional regulator [Sinorhizobium meliloti]MCO5961767.1 GlxA family transcriptional regulator [Sinorhizobium meliloti]MCO6424776.1 GlxA family transcriptional regulator [Sinorhizobium meliloti]
MSGIIDKYRGGMDSMEDTLEIGILRYDGAQAAAVLGMTDLLTAAAGIARQRHGVSHPLRVSHWTRATGKRTPERVFSSDPVSLGDRPTVIVIPPGLGDPLPEREARYYADWLRSEHSKGAGLCSICKGAFLLGETGLLAGRTVTTHWSYEEHLVSRFPDINVNTDRLIIDDGDILTAGGVMAWIDLSLILIERFLGPTIMVETARAFLVDPPGREQSYYSAFSPRLNHGDDAILKVQHWLQATGGKDMGLAVLAEHARLEPRTFMRRFQKATGHTAGEYVQRLRINKARDLLQFTRDPVDAIAWKVHYSDPSSFRKIFTRIIGLTPAEYRQRFTSHQLSPGT